MIIAGERSGDLHGSYLVRELFRLRPEVKIFGIGGPKMRSEGVQTEFDISQMAIIGFLEVIKRIRFINSALARIRSLILDRKPGLVILIDYPGFNLKIAEFAHRRGIPVLYYISPQVWAWGRKRIKRIVESVDQLAIIFDFEKEFFSGYDINVTFVGHPLLETISISLSREDFFKKYGLDSNRPILALLPGSRDQEISRILPEMVKTAGQFLKRNPECQVALSVTEGLPDEFHSYKMDGFPISGVADTYELMKYSSVMMVASGTATLESAIIGTPFVVVYRLSPLSFWLGKRLVKIKHISLANIVAGKQIVPEFIQGDFTADNVVPSLDAFLKDSAKRAELAAGFQKVTGRLGTPGASSRVARLALDLLEKK